MYFKNGWQGCLFLLLLLLPLKLIAEPQHTPLKVISFNYPPYIFDTAKSLGHGLEIDTFLAALEGSNFQPQFLFYPLKRTVQMQIDFKKHGWPIYIGAWDHFRNLPTSKDLIPIQIGSGSFFAYSRSDNVEKYKKIRRLSDLHHISVAAPRGSSIVIALRRIGIEPLEASTFDQLFKVLAARRVELGLMIDLAGEYYMQEHKIHDSIQRLKHPIFEITTDIVIPKEHPHAPALISMLTSRLAQMRTNGELKKIAEKYFGDGNVPKYFWNQRKQ